MLIVVPGRVADGVGKEGGTLLVPGAVLVHAFVVSGWQERELGNPGKIE